MVVQVWLPNIIYFVMLSMHHCHTQYCNTFHLFDVCWQLSWFLAVKQRAGWFTTVLSVAEGGCSLLLVVAGSLGVLKFMKMEFIMRPYDFERQTWHLWAQFRSNRCRWGYLCHRHRCIVGFQGCGVCYRGKLQSCRPVCLLDQSWKCSRVVM